MRTIVRVVLCVLVLPTIARADEIQLTNTLPGTFLDISSIGTNLYLSDDGYAEITTTIGNALLPAGLVAVSNNGGIAFNPPDPFLSPTNEPIPSPLAFGAGQSLLTYWDDIGNDVGGVYVYESDNALIVQWDNRLVGPGRITFEVQVFDASEVTNPYFQFLYPSISGGEGGASATIGYQDGGTGHNDSQWSYNTAWAVSDGTVLSVVPEPATALLLLAVIQLRRR